MQCHLGGDLRIWPWGATGKTPFIKPGCGACVIADLRLIMFTIGQAQT